MARTSPAIRLVISSWEVALPPLRQCCLQLPNTPGFGRESLGAPSQLPSPQHLQDTPGALGNCLLPPLLVKDDIHQPPSPPPIPADWEPFIHLVAFPGDEYFKILLFAILHKIYKMLSMCQSVLLMFFSLLHTGASWA